MPQFQNVRYCLRSLAKQPVFAAIACSSLALGIGLNTAIFSVLDALLLQPPPLRQLDRTIAIFHSAPGRDDRGTSYRAFELYRDRLEPAGRVMAAAGARPMVLFQGDRRDQVQAELVTANFFSIANLTLRLGTGFDRSVDQTSGTHLVAVLSHDGWTRHFAADPSIVGRSIILNGHSFTVIGVADAGFRGLTPEVAADLWIPMTTWAHIVGESARLTSDEHWMRTFAELNPDVSIEQAQAMIAAAFAALQPAEGEQARVRSARDYGLPLIDLLAIAGGAFAVGLLVLGLACTNVANLLLARAAARQREMSIRLALGSSRARLLRLWVLETAVLCAVASVIGLVAAWGIVDAVAAFRAPVLLGAADTGGLPVALRLDLRVFAFTVGLAGATAILVGLVAGLQGSRPRATLATHIDRAGDRRFAPGFNVRSGVIALQLTLSTLLLLPCGLFVRSAMEATTMSPGFTTANVLLLPISSNQAGVRIRKPAGFEEELIARVSKLPGVEAATVADPVPLWFADAAAHFAVEDGEPQRITYARVGTGYFDTFGIRLLRGRDFMTVDNATAPRVAIINETMARRSFPDGDAIGRVLRHGAERIEIIGVAADAKYTTLADAGVLWLYLPLAQEPADNLSLSLAVRTRGEPLQLRAAIEREVIALVPHWPLFAFRTLDEGLRMQQALPRVAAAVLGGLGLFGLLLAALGTYGVMAYVVQQRRHELGIRLALGAPLRSIITLVVRQGAGVCVVGTGIGLLLALVAARFLSSLLYGVSPFDPLTFIAVPAVLLAVALLACYLPARDATRFDPLDSIRTS
jgi:macrolide transport system ATP-binding/permease protein